MGGNGDFDSHWAGRRATVRHRLGESGRVFVTVVVTATFVITIGLELWPIITGLVLGGVVAAPFAALLTRHVPARPLMVMVGAVIVLLSVRGLIQAVW